MPVKLYDEEGNEVEAYTKEELEEKIKEAIAPLEDKLKGFEDKDYNFKKLREKVLRGEKLSEKEKEIYEREKLLEEKEKSFQEKLISSWKERAIKMFSENNQELVDKIKYFYDNDLKGIEAQTEEEIMEKVRKAYILATGQQPKQINPLYQAMGVAGSPPEKEEKKDYADTEEGRKLAELMGIKVDLSELNKK
jgi:hypothetical protein